MARQSSMLRPEKRTAPMVLWQFDESPVVKKVNTRHSLDERNAAGSAARFTFFTTALRHSAATGRDLSQCQNHVELCTLSQPSLVDFPPQKNLLSRPFFLLCGRIRKVLRSNGLDKEDRMVEKIFFRPYFQNRLIWAKVLSKPFARNHLRNQEAQTTSLFPRD